MPRRIINARSTLDQFITRLIKENSDHKKYGPFPAMAYAHLGRLLGESVCERTGSLTKRLMDKRSTSLGDEKLDQRATLNFNQNFYERAVEVFDFLFFPKHWIHEKSETHFTMLLGR